MTVAGFAQQAAQGLVGPTSDFFPGYFLLPLIVLWIWLWLRPLGTSFRGRWLDLRDRLSRSRASIVRDLQIALFHLLAIRGATTVFEFWLYDRVSTLLLPFAAHLVPWRVHWPLPVEAAAVSIVILLANDFGSYCMHRLFHRSKILWPYHAIHHEAEILTPLTTYRVHPVDWVFRNSARAFATGVILSIFYSVFDQLAYPVYWFGVGAGFFIYNCTVNLHHFPICVRYPRWLRWVFVSPHVHHLHHIVTPPFANANYGDILSVWDRMFGTYRDSEFENLGPDRLSGDIARQTEMSFTSRRTFAGDLLKPFRTSWKVIRHG